MIKLTRYTNYYNKTDFIKSVVISEEKFVTLEEALRNLQSIKLKYIENKSYISAYEEASILYKDSDGHYIKYNKTIDITTKEEKSNIPEVVEDVL